LIPGAGISVIEEIRSDPYIDEYPGIILLVYNNRIAPGYLFFYKVLTEYKCFCSTKGG
jgi:hypothetical protein